MSDITAGQDSPFSWFDVKVSSGSFSPLGEHVLLGLAL